MQSDSIVLLEADRNVALSITIALELYNFKTNHFYSAEDGINFLCNNKPMLIISSLWLQDGSVEGVINFVKSKPIFDQVPVIIMSTTGNSLTLCKKLKVSACIEKPFDLEPFLDLVINTIWKNESALLRTKRTSNLELH